MTAATQNRIFTTSVVLALFTSLTACSPSPVENTATDLQQQVKSAFLGVAEEQNVEGAFLLVRSPDGDFTATFGTTERGTNSEPTADTSFRIGSNTKTMTGTVILQLVEEGELNLDDTVSAYYPGVPNGDEITIAMLLNMRSGLADYLNDEGIWELIFADPQRAWQPEELLSMAFEGEPLFAPGTKYSYSNTNTVLLAAIAEQITGTSISQLIAERVTQPLKLARTSLPEPQDNDLEAPFTHGYTFLGEDEKSPNDVTAWNPSYTSAAGAGVSTARDLADWAEALTEGTLLSPEMQSQRMASITEIPQAPEPKNQGYGLGIAKLHGLYGHNGQIPGYNSYMGADPELDLTVIIWVNVAPTIDDKSPADLMAAKVVPLLLAG